MRLKFIAFAACATLTAHNIASATVKISGTVVDGPGGLGQLREERPISHTLSLTKNSTSVSAAGNLSTGILRATAITRKESVSIAGISFGSIDVTMGDVVTFAQGASGTAYLDWGFDGSFDVEPKNLLNNNNDGAYLNFSLTPPSGNAAGFRLATVTPGMACSGASAPNCVTGPFSHAEVAMRGSVPFEISAGVFTLQFSLGTSARGGDNADFGNTSYLYLRVPAGVNYTSSTGVFLASALPVPPPVPEPATALLFACGGLALVASRRRAARPVSAASRWPRVLSKAAAKLPGPINT